MTDDLDTASPTRAPSLLHNWLSTAGIILAASSFFAAACLIAIDSFVGFRDPYLGVLTYLVAPAFPGGGVAAHLPRLPCESGAGGVAWDRERCPATRALTSTSRASGARSSW